MNNSIIEERRKIQKITISKEDIEVCEKAYALQENFCMEFEDSRFAFDLDFESFIFNVQNEDFGALECDYFQCTGDDIDELIIDNEEN